jgi:hypothetical protein
MIAPINEPSPTTSFKKPFLNPEIANNKLKTIKLMSMMPKWKPSIVMVFLPHYYKSNVGVSDGKKKRLSNISVCLELIDKMNP